MKQKHDKKAVTVFALISILALFALIFPATSENDSVTGLLGGGQMLRTIPHAKLYKQSKTALYDLPVTHDPCKLVECGSPSIIAQPVIQKDGNWLTDEFGNVWCACKGDAELYYRISMLRKR